jgi:sulfur carrier protein ThiS
MAEDVDRIVVTIRTFIRPGIELKGVTLGKPFPFRVRKNASVAELIGAMFPEKGAEVGLVAVNGEAARSARILAEGDAVDVYDLIGGG